MTDFIEGAIFIVYAAISLFFFRFWRRSRDPLFAYFALAFLVMSATRLVLTMLELPREAEFGIRSLRLLSYALLLWGIVSKNRASHGAGRP